MEYKVVVCLLAFTVACALCDRHEAKLYPEEFDYDPLINSRRQIKSNQVKSAPDCPCGRDYFPICASDGITYGNRCMYECRAKHALKEENKHIYVLAYSRCDGKD